MPYLSPSNVKTSLLYYSSESLFQFVALLKIFIRNFLRGYLLPRRGGKWNERLANLGRISVLKFTTLFSPNSCAHLASQGPVSERIEKSPALKRARCRHVWHKLDNKSLKQSMRWKWTQKMSMAEWLLARCFCWKENRSTNVAGCRKLNTLWWALHSSFNWMLCY